jgi:hypothetical protein
LIIELIKIVKKERDRIIRLLEEGNVASSKLQMLSQELIQLELNAQSTTDLGRASYGDYYQNSAVTTATNKVKPVSMDRANAMNIQTSQNLFMSKWSS